MTLPHEAVASPDYFRDVLRSMRTIAEVHLRRVRFGTTGEGVAPNYEITYPDDHYSADNARFPHHGLTHKTHHQAPKPFDAANLSRKYSWDEVLQMLRSRLEGKAASTKSR